MTFPQAWGQDSAILQSVAINVHDDDPESLAKVKIS